MLQIMNQGMIDSQWEGGSEGMRRLGVEITDTRTVAHLFVEGVLCA